MTYQYRDVIQQQKEKGLNVYFQRQIEILWFSGPSISPKKNELAVAIVIGNPTEAQNESCKPLEEAHERHEGALQNQPMSEALREGPLSAQPSHQGDADESGIVTKSQTETARNRLPMTLKTTLSQKLDIKIVKPGSPPNKNPELKTGDILEFEEQEGIVVKSGGIGLILIKFRLEKCVEAEAENQIKCGEM
jgi:hypothetical protein